jgi:hypothetical protein
VLSDDPVAGASSYLTASASGSVIAAHASVSQTMNIQPESSIVGLPMPSSRTWAHPQ